MYVTELIIHVFGWEVCLPLIWTSPIATGCYHQLRTHPNLEKSASTTLTWFVRGVKMIKIIYLESIVQGVLVRWADNRFLKENWELQQDKAYQPYCPGHEALVQDHLLAFIARDK